MENIQAVIDAARECGKSVELYNNGQVARVFVPGFGAHASKIEIVNLEIGSLIPARKRGAVTVFDAMALNQIIADNAGAGNVTIYVDRAAEAPSVVAVMNGNGKTGPGWGDFTAAIKFCPTPQWLKWKALDGQLMPQIAFAEFIEDNLEDIARPAGAEMLEVAQYLSATREVEFKSAVRVQDGNIQFVNLEKLEAKIAASEKKVPETFTLGIAPLLGIPTYEVPCRFRYRLEGGKLRLGYKMQRTETMMRLIMDDVVGRLEPGDDGEIVDGLPPAAVK